MKFKPLMFIILLMSCFLFGYDLRIADTLGIWVEGYPDYSSTVTVGPNGEITIPTIGRLYVQGMSIEQAEKLITEKIKQRITMAKVVVGVLNFSPFKVYVLGNVAKQGAVEIRKESVKLSELIAMIGGINDRGKSSTAVIRHKDGKELTVDISKYFGNLLKDDPEVNEGDFVFFPYYYSNSIALLSEFETRLFDYYDGITLKHIVSSMNISISVIEDDIKILRNSDLLSFSIKDISAGKDLVLEKGDTIIVKKSQNYVYLYYDYSVKTMTFYEGLSIKEMISKQDLNMNTIEDTVQVLRDNKTINVSLKEVMNNKDFLLEKRDTVIIKKARNNIYLFHDSDLKSINYTELLSVRDLVQGLGNQNTLEDEIKVVRNEEIIKLSLKSVVYEKDFDLEKGDTVFITSSKNNVYLFYNSDVKSINYNDKLTLKDIYISLGGSMNNYEDQVRIIRNSKELIFSLKDVIYGSDVKLFKDDKIFVNSSKNNIYLFYNSDVRVMAYNDLLTLKDVYMGLGGSLNNYEDEVIVQRGEETIKISLKEVVYGKDFNLKKGDYLFITPSKNSVYVYSDFTTKVLEYTDMMTLKDVFNSLGVTYEEADDEVSILRDDKLLTFSISDIVFGSKAQDIKIEKSDTVFFKKYEKYVFAMINQNITKVEFKKKDEFTVLMLLSKLGMNPKAVDYIKYGDKELSVSDVLTDKAYIIIEPLKNTVYLNGSFKSTGKISFEFDESLTLAKIFSVAGFKEDFSGRLIVINAGGVSLEYRIDTKDMSKYLDIAVEPQSVLVAFPGERIIYSVGEVADVIAYKDGDTFYDIAMRYKLDKSYEIRYSLESTQSTVNAGNVEVLKSIPLNGKVFMEVTKKVSDYIVVYKDGNSKIFEAKKPVKLIEAFDSMQGFSPSDRGVIKVFTGDTIAATYTNYDIINHPLTAIPNGSYVVIQPDVKYSYINVFGSVGFNSIRTDIPITLVEILARSGNNWSNQYEVVIYRPDETRERIKIEDIDLLSRTFVEPGSIVYLPTYDKQIIYMLGQVGAPGVVQYVKGMTLFDALIRAGGVRKDGEPANVFLFKDGPDNPPITLDVSPLFRNSVSLKSSMNPELKPGDIVYVPKSLMTNVVEAMSTVTSFLEFINSTTNSVYNLVNIFGKK